MNLHINYLVGAFAAVEGDGKLLPTAMAGDPWGIVLAPEVGGICVVEP